MYDFQINLTDGNEVAILHGTVCRGRGLSIEHTKDHSRCRNKHVGIILMDDDIGPRQSLHIGIAGDMINHVRGC